MAKEKSIQTKIKRLYKQLSRVQNQPLTRQCVQNPTKTYKTLRGKIEHIISTLEKSKPSSR